MGSVVKCTKIKKRNYTNIFQRIEAEEILSEKSLYKTSITLISKPGNNITGKKKVQTTLINM